MWQARPSIEVFRKVWEGGFRRGPIEIGEIARRISGDTDYFVLSLLIMSVVGKQYDLCTILPVS
jgi:hypothetical protein